MITVHYFNVYLIDTIWIEKNFE